MKNQPGIQSRLLIGASGGGISFSLPENDNLDQSFESEGDRASYEAQKVEKFYKTTNLIAKQVHSIADIQISTYSDTELSRHTSRYFQNEFGDSPTSQELVPNSASSQAEIQKSNKAPLPSQEVKRIALLAEQLQEQLHRKYKSSKAIGSSQTITFMRNLMIKVEADHQMRHFGWPEKSTAFSSHTPQMQVSQEGSNQIRACDKEKLLIEKAKYLVELEGLTYHQASKRLKVTQYKIRLWKKFNFDWDKLQFQSKNRRQKYKKFSKRVRDTLTDLIKTSAVAIQVPQLVADIYKATSIKISETQLKKYLKEALGMSYRKINSVSLNHNKFPNLVKRQYAAAAFIEEFARGKIIINIDESVLRSTDERKRGWMNKGQRNLVTYSQRLSQTNIIAAITSQGDTFFTVNRGKTNSQTFILFMEKLTLHLDSVDQRWRERTIIFIDNAPYHRSRATANYIRQNQIPLAFLGPYQFRMAPIELYFSYIKSRDLNPAQMRLSSKQAMN